MDSPPPPWADHTFQFVPWYRLVIWCFHRWEQLVRKTLRYHYRRVAWEDQAALIHRWGKLVKQKLNVHYIQVALKHLYFKQPSHRWEKLVNKLLWKDWARGPARSWRWEKLIKKLLWKDLEVVRFLLMQMQPWYRLL